MLDGAQFSSSLRLVGGVVMTCGESLFPIHDDHPLDFVNAKLLDVVSLADKLNEGSHRGQHLRYQNHRFQVLWESATRGSHPHEVGADLFDSERRVGVSRDGGIHRASELLEDGGDPWFSVFCCDPFPYSECNLRSIILLSDNRVDVMIFAGFLSFSS